MPNSQVPRIELKADGSINIKVSVYGFDAGTPVQLSGQATQINGAVATFYEVQTTPGHDGDTVDLWVKSVAPVPPKKFDPGFPITVAVQATENWITTLDTSSERDSEVVGSGALTGAWAASNWGWAVTPSSSGTAQPGG